MARCAPLVEERAAREESVTFLGRVEQQEVTDLMASTEVVVVVPSQWYEGAPLLRVALLRLEQAHRGVVS